MRKIWAVTALLACVAASPVDRAPDKAPAENHRLGFPDDKPSETVCRDRIHAVRAERGLPKLDREPASVEKPLLVAAVDRRIEGCSVLVMSHDTSDVRPIPKPDGRTTLRPAR